MAKFNFYLKDRNSDGPTAVYLYIRSNGGRLKYYTGQSIEPKFWDIENQKAVKVKHAPEFNTTLKDLQTNAEIATNRLKVELKAIPSPEQIRDELNKIYNLTLSEPEPKKTDFLTFFEEVAEKTKIRNNLTTGKPLSLSRSKTIKQTMEVLKGFQSRTNCKLDFDKIDRDFYDNFKNYMEKVKHYSANNIGKHFKTIKVILNEATEQGINTNLKYKSKYFKIITEPANSIYLTEPELMDLQKLDLSKKPRLAKVRDLFLIGAWTGLRFSDFSRLTKENIFTDADGHKNFKIKTMKTDMELEIPILPQTMKILDIYGGADSLSLPESISNQKMNEYLKEIGQKVESLQVPFIKDRTTAGLKISTNKMKWEYLSTHAARRSFASNMYERGISVPFIMSITGHKTEQEFYKYIQIDPGQKAKLFRNEFFKSNLKVAL